MSWAVLVAAMVMLVVSATAAATTYTVTTTADSNHGSCMASPCSLRDAINGSAAGDTVVVPAGTYKLSVLPGALAISHSLTITGGGAASTTVQQTSANSGVLSVSGTNVSISNLTITGGSLTGASSAGAGISTTGNLTLTGVSVTGNQIQTSASGNPAGAGIYMNGGNLTLRSSQVSGNQLSSTGSSSPAGAGIAIAAGGLASISDSQITSNAVSVGTSPVAQGGGIYNGGSGTLAISRSQITGNSVAVTGTGHSQGGGVSNFGTGVVTIDQSSISTDTASAGSTSSPAGGGLAGANFIVSGSAISANSATGGSGSVVLGGGVNIADSSLTATTIGGNTADGADNEARGGGVFLADTSITNTTIAGNTARTTGTGALGGGIFATGTTGSSPVLNSTIDGNSAPGGSGGNVYVGSGSIGTENTIVSGGTATTGPNCSGTLTSQGHNVESGTDCGFAAAGDHQNTDPLLGPLQDNGGPTQTQAVQPGSAVIDAGNTADCPATDQRGVSRPQGPACDIGALEVEPPVVSTGSASGVSRTAATLNGTVNPNTLKASAASYHFDWGTTTAYGNATPASSGSGAVSASLNGLSPNTTYHFRVVATNAEGGSATGADQSFTTSANPLPPPPLRRPKLTALGETHRIFAVGVPITPINKSAPDNRVPVSNAPVGQRHPKGTVFTFTLNLVARVKIKILAQKPGRLQGRKCKPPSRRLQNRPRCTRSIPQVTLTRAGIPGLNLVSFSGRLPHRKLLPGRYQAVFTATNAAGTSGPQAIAFTIVKQ